MIKPESSRSSSAEAFVCGFGFHAGGSLGNTMSKSMQGLRDELEVADSNPEAEVKKDQIIKEAEESEEEEDLLTF